MVVKLSQTPAPPGHTSVNESVAIEVFSAVRPRLFGVAYRMLGSVADAEDIVQNVWLRWQTYDLSKVNDPTAFLVTTAARLCINELQSARVRRETYVGPWLPDPVDTGSDPTLGAERVEALEFVTLLVMEKLPPAERAAYVLREAFDYPYAKIAQVIRASEANARQLVSRARKHIASDRQVPVDSARHRDLLAAFLNAAVNGEMTALEELFVEDVVSYTDGNGARNAARFPVVGKTTVAKFILVFRQRVFTSANFTWVTVNNQPAVIVSHPDGTFETFIALTVTPAGISQVLWHRLEDKVKHLLSSGAPRWSAGAGSDLARIESAECPRFGEASDHEPGQHPGDEGAGQHCRDGEDGGEFRCGAGIVDDQLVDGQRESGHRTGQYGDGEVPASVEEQREHQFRTEALDESRLDGHDSPLVADQRRHRGGDQLAVQGGAGFADHQCGQHAGEQPAAADQSLQAGQQGDQRGREGIGGDVPEDEDQAGGHGEDAGDDDVDNPPAQGGTVGDGLLVHEDSSGGRAANPSTDEHG